MQRIAPRSSCWASEESGELWPLAQASARSASQCAGQGARPGSAAGARTRARNCTCMEPWSALDGRTLFEPGSGEGLEAGETGAGSPPDAAGDGGSDGGGALRREWTSAEASPYCPQARPVGECLVRRHASGRAVEKCVRVSACDIPGALRSRPLVSEVSVGESIMTSLTSGCLSPHTIIPPTSLMEVGFNSPSRKRAHFTSTKGNKARKAQERGERNHINIIDEVDYHVGLTTLLWTRCGPRSTQRVR
eukprot:scaffold4526_cov89-Isochrysis_galbana.AAC.8